MLHSMGLNHRDISKLGSVRCDLVIDPFNLPNEKSIICNVTFKNKIFSLQALLNNKLVCIADGSFYPDRSHLTPTAWFSSMDGKVISFGDFTSSVPIEHSNPFDTCICGILHAMITAYHILTKCPNSSTSIKITVG